MRVWQASVGAMVGLVVCSGAVLAAEPDPAAVQAPVKGVDVMGDKGRSLPDGWAWAPVTRDQSATGKAAGETASAVHGAPNTQASNESGKSLSPGQDPGTPAATQNAGPGVMDASANTRRP